MGGTRIREIREDTGPCEKGRVLDFERQNNSYANRRSGGAINTKRTV